MRSLACATLLLCLGSALAAHKEFDVKEALDRIIKDLLPRTYSARIEVTVNKGADTQETIPLIEYHDGTNDIHTLEYTDKPERYMYFGKGGKQSFAHLVGFDRCDQSRPDQAPKDIDKDVSFMYAHSDAGTYLGATTLIKQIPSKNIQKLPGPATVRGMPVETYAVSTLDRQYTIYFIPDWTIHVPSADPVQFPVRIQVTGDKNTAIVDFYEIQDLSPSDVARLGDKFQIMFGRGECTSLEPPKGVTKPNLHEKFAFTTEVVGSPLTSTREWFDLSAVGNNAKSRLHRCDDRDGKTKILDEAHGVIYTVGSFCDMKPNINGEVMDTTNGARIVRAFALKDMFYVGEGNERGIPVNIWQAQGDEDIELARFYMTQKSTEAAVDAKDETEIPVRVTIRNAGTFDEDFYIFDYYATDRDNDFRKNFDIEECHTESRFVEIELEANRFDKEQLEDSNALHEMSAQLHRTITNVTGISQLQVPHVEMEIKDEQHVIAMVKILASPTHLSAFSGRAKKYPVFEADKIDSTSDEACAKRCIDSADKCLAMLHCPGNDCYLMKTTDDSQWGKADKPEEKHCLAFDKSPHVVPSAYTPLDDIVKTIVTEALKNSVFDITATSGEGEINFHVKNVNPLISEFIDQGAQGSYRYLFSSKSIDPEHTASQVVDGIETVGACYRECIDSSKECASFSLCSSTKKCVYTSVTVNAGTKRDDEAHEGAEVVKASPADCSTFTVNYLTQFDRIEGKTRSSGTGVSDGGSTAAECALNCRQKAYKDLKACRSFEFCAKDKTCLFHETHFSPDSKDSDIADNPSCDHYSLRYTADFTPVKKGLFKVDATIAEDISMADCAKRCAEDSDGNCKSFAYCDSAKENEEQRTCFMYGEVSGPKGETKAESYCTIYLKSSHVPEVIKPSRQEKETTDTVYNGMTKGGLAGLLIAMLIVGIVFGAAGYYQRDTLKRLVGRGNAPVGATISYNRQEDEQREREQA